MNLPRFARTVATQEEGGGTDPTEDTTAVDSAAPAAEDTGQSDSKAQEEAAPQEEFDASRALAKIRKSNAEAEALRKRAKAAEAKAASVDDLTRERDALALQVRQLKVGGEYGLPAALAERLRGDSEEEMKKDAEQLLAIFERRTPPSQTPRTSEPAGATQTPKTDPKEPSIEEIGARMFRR